MRRNNYMKFHPGLGAIRTHNLESVTNRTNNFVLGVMSVDCQELCRLIPVQIDFRRNLIRLSASVSLRYLRRSLGSFGLRNMPKNNYMTSASAANTVILRNALVLLNYLLQCLHKINVHLILMLRTYLSK